MQNNKELKPDSLSLDQTLPDGQVVNRQWLQKKGFKRSTIDYYLRAGRLKKVGRGVYRRPGPPLKWEHLLYSLQELGYKVHIGGQSALDLQGYAHYLSLGGTKKVTLYSETKLPSWPSDVLDDLKFMTHMQKCFKKPSENSMDSRTFGHWDWQLYISTVELALFEFLEQVNDEAGFSQADKYFESATTLRPKLLNELLQGCSHIKTKRLFMWFADRHDHQWFKAIERAQVDLGSGKRAIIKGGALDSTYNITVPREMTHNDQLFF